MKVLITGGGSGIGRSVALAVVASGGTAVVVGRTEARLIALQKEVRGIRALVADVADEGERKGLVARAKKLLGGLDGFVHSAGVIVHERPGQISEPALRAQMEVNLVAPLRLGEEALTVLPRGGSMVFISSTLAHRPLVTSAAYSASKAGMNALMKSLALAGAARGIRVNAVLPGLVDTGMISELRLSPGERAPSAAERKRRLAEQKKAMDALHPLGRVGTPDEVARSVLHVLSATWMTGSEVVLDGGLLLRE